MLKTKFYLTDAKSTGQTAIYAACYLEGQRKKIYVPNLTVTPKQWDTEKQQFRKSFTNYSEANVMLKRLVEELETANFSIRAKGQVTTADDLRQVVAQVTGGAKEPGQLTFLDYVDRWIEDSRRDRASNTIRGYLTLRKHLVDYTSSRRLRLDFATLDGPFFEGFKNYLLRSAGLTNTSINNHVKNIKVFFNVTFEQGVHEYQHHKRFKKMEALETDLIYLTAEEKTALATLNLDYMPRLECTRDVFLFECETGLRFSDVKALRPEQVDDKFIILTTQKTADVLKIPLSPVARAILRKYNDVLPVKSNQKTNADLKQIAKLAKIDKQVGITHLRGKKRETETQPKWQVVCTHTARRTFITLALEGGMRPEVVQKITGHKDFKTLLRYAKITDTVVQNEFEEYVNRQATLFMRAS